MFTGYCGRLFPNVLFDHALVEIEQKPNRIKVVVKVAKGGDTGPILTFMADWVLGADKTNFPTRNLIGETLERIFLGYRKLCYHECALPNYKMWLDGFQFLDWRDRIGCCKPSRSIE